MPIVRRELSVAQEGCVDNEAALWTILVIASATDLLWGKIYNILTLPAIIVGLGLRYHHAGFDGLWDSLLAILIAFCLYYPLYLLKTFGAADVKLLMAIGAWSNHLFVIKLGAVAVVIGAAVCVWILLQKRGLCGSLHSLRNSLNTPRTHTLKIPYAPAFFCAFLLIRGGGVWF